MPHEPAHGSHAEFSFFQPVRTIVSSCQLGKSKTYAIQDSLEERQSGATYDNDNKLILTRSHDNCSNARHGLVLDSSLIDGEREPTTDMRLPALIARRENFATDSRALTLRRLVEMATTKKTAGKTAKRSTKKAAKKKKTRRTTKKR